MRNRTDMATGRSDRHAQLAAHLRDRVRRGRLAARAAHTTRRQTSHLRRRRCRSDLVGSMRE